MLRAVCFDLMGTVIADPYREALHAATGMDLTTAHAVKDHDAWPAFEIAEIDELTFVRRFFTDPAIPFDADAFHRARRSGYAWLPGMRELLDELAGRVERYAASNYPVWVEELAQSFAFAQRFEAVYASCHLGVRKPAAAFYELLLEKIGHDAADCLFVDDRPINCDAAEEVGMRAHVFDGAEALRARLADEGVQLPS
jgi:HAD superfamily hydrolase (TIGR01509 family)